MLLRAGVLSPLPSVDGRGSPRFDDASSNGDTGRGGCGVIFRVSVAGGEGAAVVEGG